ncbi:MAG: hypothetical protein AAGD43_02630 [Pseudomonadota bacterium]
MSAPDFNLPLTTVGELKIARVEDLDVGVDIVSEELFQTIADALEAGGVIDLNNYGGIAQATTAEINIAADLPIEIFSRLKIKYRCPATNTAADPTLALNGGDPFPIRDNGNNPLEPGDLQAGRLYDLRLTGSAPNQRWEVSNSGLTIAQLLANSATVISLDTRAAFESIAFPAVVIAASFMSGGIEHRVVRDAAGTAITSNGGSVNWSPAGGVVNPLAFADNTDPGITNMTAAIREAHEFANEHQRPVVYYGMGRTLVDANARIVVNTSTDWLGSVIEISGGIMASPAFDAVNVVYRVYDEDTPEVTGTQVITPGIANKGSTTYTTDFFSEVGYVFIQGIDGLRVPARTKDDLSGEDFAISTWVQRNGQNLYPLTFDFTGTNTFGYAFRRMPSFGRLKLQNITVDPTTFNNQCIIQVERNNTEIDGVQAVHGAQSASNSVNRIIQFYRCGFLTAKNVAGTGQENAGGGSYLIDFDESANVELENICGVEGWGAMASRYLTGLTVRSSKLNRVDGHQGLGYATIVDTVLKDIGVVFGSAWGYIRVINPTLINCPAIASRTDYGGFVWGDLLVQSPTLIGNTFSQAIVDLRSNPIGARGFQLPAAYSVTVKDIVRNAGDDNGDEGQIEPLAMAIASDAGDDGGEVYFPDNVELDGFKGVRHRLKLYLPLNDMKARSSSHDIVISVANMRTARAVGGIEEGIFVPAQTINGVHGDFSFELQAHNIDNLHLNMSNYSTQANAYISHCTTNGIRGAANQQIFVSDTRFFDALLDGAETQSRVGAGGGGTDDTQMRDCFIAGDNWDLTDVKRASGVIWNDSRANITLPATATRAAFATGWFDAKYLD